MFLQFLYFTFLFEILSLKFAHVIFTFLPRPFAFTLKRHKKKLIGQKENCHDVTNKIYFTIEFISLFYCDFQPINRDSSHNVFENPLVTIVNCALFIVRIMHLEGVTILVSFPVVCHQYS